ncbi:MAG: class I SAM-dependent methyltransferase [Bacteroidota bacterium]
MPPNIKSYYDELAENYDQDRFANSYGKFIHRQEEKTLARHVSKNEKSKILDLACGTGRFLHHAAFGVDISEEMLKVARVKFPNADLRVGDGTNLPFEDNFFTKVLSFHLMMHIDRNKFICILEEVGRVTQKGGLFIFDVPSKKRRELTRYKAKSWHGGHEISVSELKDLCGDRWELLVYHGIAFFPIHHIPKSLRSYILDLDTLLCNSFLGEFSSHIIYVLKKK